ncbi:6-phosphogluconate dehydrogenase [Xylona heveae TC161]|uniref:6-phosphogluconate dehydrogenase n=1 Tax=Xylona heveae (strain CBS 132557 / TC161) TaxID=1328760 RepID=A0A164ZW06_XYLHT|nr:6-phosphogluconate dehydrogenase [Xylona heveae TC161]KZF19602.1 6-phosphogluconate dehydrogenase [Xylona heveae TC161]
MTSTLNTDTRLGWIGLGSMGIGMSKNLQKYLAASGAPPLSYTNRTLSRGDGLKALGGVPYETVGGVVANSDIIFTCVSNDQVLNSVIDEVLASGSSGSLKGKIFVDSTTVHPETTISVAKKLTDAHAEFVAAPVFGASAMAEAGKLIFTLAGPESATSKLSPYLVGVMAKSIIPMGEDVSKSTLLKIAGNVIVISFMEVISEAHVLAEKTGLGSQILETMLGDMFGPVVYSYSKRITSGAYAPPIDQSAGFGVDLALKDVRHALRVASENGTTLDALEAALKHMQRAKAFADSLGGRPLDSSSMYGAIRRDAGLDFFSDAIKARDASL